MPRKTGGGRVDHRDVVAVDIGHINFIGHRIDGDGDRGGTRRDGGGGMVRPVDHRDVVAVLVSHINFIGHRIDGDGAGTVTRRDGGGHRLRPDGRCQQQNRHAGQNDAAKSGYGKTLKLVRQTQKSRDTIFAENTAAQSIHFQPPVLWPMSHK